ncbi:hypothetical protein ODJ79_04715 [Actinoplanes sp. KI2]|uniref:hypothetical protein n=1 Tax=Actinoplanes sp. KI2 TaxID=2983315 RepID=UPI0021D5A7BD|nr:hypothetical protein [Actinoplanes sp. KI2]MCU7723009.1 hypothetical protein [Actinoplanes sp. KI2]
MRRSVPAALAALVMGLFVLLFGAAPARAAAIYLEVNPSTVPAGDQVGLRASCTDNLKPASVSSGLFGTVAVNPEFGLLTATVTIPGGAKPGDYKIDLHCPDNKSASATLHVVAKVEPAQGPATGGGGMAPERYAPMLIGSGLVIFGAGVALGLISLRRRRVG